MTFADPEAPDAEPHRPTSNTPSPTGPRKAAGLMVCEVTDTATRSSRTIDILHRHQRSAAWGGGEPRVAALSG